jgi:hypothetical protein
MIMNLPDGIGVLPFLLPGTPQLMNETMLSMREHLPAWRDCAGG